MSGEGGRPGATVETRVLPPSPEAIAEAAALLRAGRLVAFPTETVYGLGADAASPDAVAAIYAAKGRPPDNPCVVHVADWAAALGIAAGDGPGVARLVARFWPGPLTLVLRARAGLAPQTLGRNASGATVAVRQPAHPVAAALLAATGRPLAAPSANRSGRPSPTTAAHVVDDLAGRVPLVLDGGPCAVGLESTVLDVTGARPRVLRPGAVTAAAVAEALGIAEGEVETDGDAVAALASPGTRYPHYRPRAPVWVLAGSEAGLPDGALLGVGLPVEASRVGWIGPHAPPWLAGATLDDGAPAVLPRADVEALARSLYADLRALEAAGAQLIVVRLPSAPDAALRDRLRRAASLWYGPR